MTPRGSSFVAFGDEYVGEQVGEMLGQSLAFVGDRWVVVGSPGHNGGVVFGISTTEPKLVKISLLQTSWSRDLVVCFQQKDVFLLWGASMPLHRCAFQPSRAVWRA